ncbi:MAG TPA: hypothetical protein ENN29_08240, partial [Candidatus Hydrogenedentes bacterium]|nr:hypothetical protein [Candidatus Hydrogenedentota bacterium]
MRLKRIIQVFSVFALCCAVPSHGQVAEQVAIRGQLLDAAGNPLYGMRDYNVEFFDAASGGASLGGPITGTIEVSLEGLFVIELTLPVSVAASGTAWYELAIDSSDPPDGIDGADIFAGRIPVRSVPFAVRTGAADFVAVGDVGAGAITDAEFESLSGVTGNIQLQLDNKPDNTEVYLRNDIDAALALKADAADVYSRGETDTALALKADADSVYTKTETDNLIATATEPLLQWQVVNAASVAAAPNTGYLVNTANKAVLALPESGDLTAGDVIRIRGMGAGGWQLAQNSGQRITLEGLGIAAPWNARLTDAPRTWQSLACSADGQRIVAAASGHNIFTSSDGGVTWVEQPGSDALLWRGIASSDDGMHLVAAAQSDYVYTSADGGVTWTQQLYSGSYEWRDVASSGTGQNLAAAVRNGYIFTSSDWGESWTQCTAASNRHWRAIASSADGMRLVAAAYDNYLYTSDDGGVTWTSHITDMPRWWYFVSSSADGMHLAAVVYGGHIYTSSDGGDTWQVRDQAGTRQWRALASSADGQVLLSPVYDGYLYVSRDGGNTWSTVMATAKRNWLTAAVSADGSFMAAAVWEN